MPNTFSKIYIHLIFAVKGRHGIIQKSWETDLFKYITGIITNKNQKLLAINGYKDHIHILLNIKPNISLSDLVRDIKNNSTKYINNKKYTKGKFSWQEGFGAFSYSESQLPNIIKYINNQKEHHKRRTFKEEYQKFLEKYKINYDEKYLFNFNDNDK